MPGAVSEPGSEAVGTGSLDVGDGGPISEKGREPMLDSQLPVDNNEATGFTNVVLTNTNFNKADFKGAKRGGDVRSASFSRVNLEDAKLRRTRQLGIHRDGRRHQLVRCSQRTGRFR